MSPDRELALARELAQPVLFDEGVEAARNACVAGASIAAAAVTAAAYYDNPLTGIGALRAALDRLQGLPLELEAWRGALTRDHDAGGFAPGFGFVDGRQAAAVRAAARRLFAVSSAGAIGRFAVDALDRLAPVSGPLNPTGLAALAFLDAGVDGERAERRFLLWRVETAVAEAQQTRQAGLAAFPFLTEGYVYEGPRPPVREFDVEALRRTVGLD